VTLGIGMRPSREEAVVLIADSLMPSIDSDGKESYGLDKKLLWLAGADTALVISGYISDDELRRYGIVPDYQPLTPGLPQEPDPRARVRRTFPAIQRIDAGVRARHPGFDGYADLDDPGPHALFVAPSLLAKYTSKTEAWAEPGDVFIIGSWLLGMPADIAIEMQLPAPDTAEECKQLAADWVRRFMDKIFGYRDPFQMARETGEICTIGFPLQVVTMAADQIQREVIPQ
jgi:hypothetical protein